jgi:hypothetical protein
LDIRDLIYLEKKDEFWIFDYKRASTVIDHIVNTQKSKTGGHVHPLSSADRKPLEFSDDLDLLLNPQKNKNWRARLFDVFSRS